jgi:hypothetical protein
VRTERDSERKALEDLSSVFPLAMSLKYLPSGEMQTTESVTNTAST